MSSLDAWLKMYGKKVFASFFDNTNLELLRRGSSPFKNMADALQFHGMVRLVTYFEFGKWDYLWSTVGRKYIPYVEFGKTGMGRDRFKHRDTQNNYHTTHKI